MADPNMRIVLTTGEEFTVPLSRYSELGNGVIVLNREEGKYTIFPIGISYIVREKAVAAEKDSKKETKKA